MKRIDEIWTRLVTAARQTPPDGEVFAPAGFATRVVAHGFNARRTYDSMIERLAVRMMGVSCLIALFAVLTYVSLENASDVSSESDALFHLEDPVTLFVGDVSDE